MKVPPRGGNALDSPIARYRTEANRRNDKTVFMGRGLIVSAISVKWLILS